MANHENTNAAIEDAINASQVLFTANPLFLTPQSKHFFEAQQRILDEVETFSTAWFQRRQDAVQAMVDSARRIASEGGRDPAKMIKEATEFQAGAMKRISEDAKTCTEMLTHCAEAVSRNEVEAMQETADNTQRATTTAKSDPV